MEQTSKMIVIDHEQPLTVECRTNENGEYEYRAPGRAETVPYWANDMPSFIGTVMERIDMFASLLHEQSEGPLTEFEIGMLLHRLVLEADSTLQQMAGTVERALGGTLELHVGKVGGPPSYGGKVLNARVY